jgi:hypothetical protein
MTLEETGNGITVEDKRALFAHRFQGIVGGEKAEWPSLYTDESSGDQIRALLTAQDGLTS